MTGTAAELFTENEKLKEDKAKLEASRDKLLDALQDAANCPYWSRDYGNHFSDIIGTASALKTKMFNDSLPY